MIVFIGLVQKEDQKTYKKLYSKSMFTRDKYCEIYKKNIKEVYHGLERKYLNMNPMKKSIIQEQW